MGTILADSNEAMRYEYISAILHVLLYIVKRIITDKELTLVPQLEVAGEESTGRVNYAIKVKLFVISALLAIKITFYYHELTEDLICITENKQHKVRSEYQTA